MSLLHTCRVAMLALAVGAISVVLAPSAYATDTSFQYELNPQHNFGKCLDIAGASTASDAPLQQFDCNNQPNQRFRFNRISGNVYEIRPVHSSNKCLDVANASIANGAPVNQFTCNGQANQRFRLLDDSPPDVPGFSGSRIVAVHSNKCLDVAGASNANGAPVIQFTCHGQANQRFDGLAFAD